MNSRLHTTIAQLLITVLLMTAGLTGVAAEPPAPQQKSSKPVEYDKLSLPDLQARADKEDQTAQFELGSRHNYGRGLPKNTREALRWLRRAAQAGQTDAMRLLAVKLYGGFDVPADFDEAFRWANALAETGDRQGQMMLANMYGNGEGAARNLVRACAWYGIAATLRPGEEPGTEASALIESAISKREQTIKLLLPDQEVESQQQASDWWKNFYEKEAARQPSRSPSK